MSFVVNPFIYGAGAEINNGYPLAFQGVHNNVTDGSSFDFDAIDLGPEFPARWIYVFAACTKGGLTVFGITDLTIDLGGGAVSMALQASQDFKINFDCSAWMYYAPEGTSADFVVSASTGCNNAQIYVFTSDHLLLDAFAASGNPNIDMTMEALRGGNIAAALSQGGLSAHTIDLENQLFNAAIEGNRYMAASEQVNLDGPFEINTVVGGSSMQAVMSVGRAPDEYLWVQAGTGSTVTFDDKDIGEESSDRLIVLSVAWSRGALVTGLSGITYDVGAGPVAMTRAVQSAGGSQTHKAEIFYATIPTGLTADFEVSIGDVGGIILTAFRKTGLASNTPIETAVEDGTTSPTTTIDVTAGDFIVQSVMNRSFDLRVSEPDLRLVGRIGLLGLTGCSLIGIADSTDATYPVGITTSQAVKVAVATWA